MTNAQEWLTIPAGVGRRRRRVRPEDDPRLREAVDLERAYPWVRVGFRGQRGYARTHPGSAGLLEFVPDDGEAVVATASVKTRAKIGKRANIRAIGRLNPRQSRGLRSAPLPPPPGVSGEREWWARVEPDGTVTHVLTSAAWVRKQTAVRDVEAERRARALAAKRAR